MVLSEEDKNWFKEALYTEIKKLGSSLDNMGKRVVRLECAFGLLARASRTAVVENAKKNHAKLLDKMFTDSDLLVLPKLVGGEGRKSRAQVDWTTTDVEAVVNKYNDKFEVELAKVGFRLVHSSRSAQRRRKEGATFLKHAKATVEADLGMILQYDKPYELREIQTAAHKFLALLKKTGGSVITETGVKGGYLLVNGVPLAPEFLVPRLHRWKGLADFAVEKFRAWGKKQPEQSDAGVMYDTFCEQFAADAGVFDLRDVRVDDDGDGARSAELMDVLYP